MFLENGGNGIGTTDPVLNTIASDNEFVSVVETGQTNWAGLHLHIRTVGIHTAVNGNELGFGGDFNDTANYAITTEGIG